MSSVTLPTGTITYEYNPDGIKVKTDDGLNPKWYLIDTQQLYAQVIAEYDNASSLTAEYVFGLERISQDRGGSVSVYLADGQGSIRKLTNSSGTITDTYDYFAFGELLNKTGTTENEFRYVGEHFDPNIQNYYLRARWYDPSLGRFTSVDPFSGDPMAPVSLHRYLYGNASPVSYIDPSGRMSLLDVMYTAVIVNTLAAGAYVNYTHWLGRKTEPVQWRGIVAPLTIGSLDPEAPLWTLGPTFGMFSVALKAESEDKSTRASANYVVLSFGWGAGLQMNISGGPISLETPGIFGYDPELLSGHFLWASATAFFPTFTGVTMGMGRGDFKPGWILGLDFSVEVLSGWAWCFDKDCSGPLCTGEK